MTAAEDPLGQLAELPLDRFESIGRLERSDHGPFLTIKPHRAEVLRPSIPLPDVPLKTSRMVRTHFAWATFPVVVCHDPGPFLDGLQIPRSAPDRAGSGRADDEALDLAGRVEHYRLSTLGERTFPRPLWCTVRYGPWYGKFIEQESCTEGDNEHRWDFYLEGVQAPDLGVTSWFGDVDDMPSVPSLSVIWGTLQSDNPTYPACGKPGFLDMPGPIA